MMHVRICTVGLFVAFLVFSAQQALAGCGFAAAYLPEGRLAQSVSAAHRSLPLGTRVVVRNQRTGRSIIVRIAERSPFVGKSVIDLSSDAMDALDMDARAPVCVEVISYGSRKRGYEKPSLIGRLLEAASPKRHHYAKASSRTHSAKASSEVRSAKVRRPRKHSAGGRHGGGKRYAELHRHHSVRRSGRRHHAARG
jgi:rare lipoprotein A